MIISFSNQSISKKSRQQKLFFTAVLAGVLLIIFFNNPQKSILPKCYFKSITGYDCPSCGLSRSFHALSHLNFLEAFHSHIFGPAIFLFLLLVFMKLLIEIIFQIKFRLQIKSIVLKVAGAAFFCSWIIYWITRLV